MDEKRKSMLKSLPKIDEIIGLAEKQGIFEKASREIVLEVCRSVVQKMRDDILTAPDKKLPAVTTDAAGAARYVSNQIDNLYAYRLKRVVNATGVILHTNLGRAPLCPEALERILEVGRGCFHRRVESHRRQHQQTGRHAGCKQGYPVPLSEKV